jgi:hypothetical protein
MSKNIGIKNTNNIFLFSSKKLNCCDIIGKYKVINNSNQSVIPQHTKVRRNVDTILYSLGGRTQYGLQPQRIRNVITLFGNREKQSTREEQSGSIFGPIKNKF